LTISDLEQKKARSKERAFFISVANVYAP